MSAVQVEPLTQHADPRGSLWEPLPGSALADKRNVHVAVTEPGAVRGNHFHTHGTEVLVVTGPALVRWDEDGHVHEREVSLGEVVRFTIPPGIPHAVKNNGLRACLLVAFNTAAHDPAHPDSVAIRLF